VAAPGVRLTEAEVLAHLRSRVAGYKRPRRVYFVASLPRNASLKVRKDVLKDQLA
jgi:acyl-coenzyme A synthetase/AMP-(fatty) acid ligase